MAAEHSLVVFDGVCNLCNASVQFIIRRDPERRYIFAAAQSPYAQQRVAELGLAGLNMESFVLIEAGKAYLRTDAALRIATSLSGAWFLFALFRLLPGPIRDAAYNALGRHRYRLFGRRSECLLPTPELQARFRWDVT